MNETNLPTNVAASDESVALLCRLGAPEDSISYLMRRIVAHVSGEIERRMEPLGLTDAQWKPLVRLFSSGDTTVAALARGCHLDAGAMTRMLDRLEAKGLCRRIRSLEDRRVVNLELTDEGRIAAEQIPAVVGEVQEVAARGLTHAEFLQLRSLLNRVLTNVLPFGTESESASHRVPPSVFPSEGSKNEQ